MPWPSRQALSCQAAELNSAPAAISNWPPCSTDCSRIEDHRLECEHFVKNKVMVKSERFNFSGSEVAYDSISPLRVWLMSKSGNKSDKHCTKAFYELESHLEKWKQDEGWVENHKAVHKHLKEELKCDISFEELLQIYGIFYTNDFRFVYKHHSSRSSVV